MELKYNLKKLNYPFNNNGGIFFECPFRYTYVYTHTCDVLKYKTGNRYTLE